MSEPRTITLTTRATVAVGIFAGLMLLLLAAQFVFIVQQRQLIGNQLHIARRQEDRARPVLSTVDRLLGSRTTRETARRAGATLGDLQGLLDTTRRTRAVEVTAAVMRSIGDSGLVRGAGRFLQAALSEDLVGSATRALRRTPELLGDVSRAVAVLDRAYPTLRTSLRVQRDTRGLQVDAVRMQRESLAIQRQTLALTQQLRDIAQQTLEHAASIDRKTGGTLGQGG